MACSRLALLITHQKTEIMRKRFKVVQINGQFKKVETRTATKAVWAESVTCVHVTSQTVAGAEKSRRYLKATPEKVARLKERAEKDARRKAFYQDWENKHHAELFRDADKNLSFIH